MRPLKKRDESTAGLERFDPFERMFEDWTKLVPFRRMFGTGDWDTEQVIRVDEFRENGTLVIRAEMPGVDPDKDVVLTVDNGMLHITAERKEEETSEEKGFVRRELRFGSFSRTLPVPPGVTESDVIASYKDGILEIRVPAPTPTLEPPKKIVISKA